MRSMEEALRELENDTMPEFWLTGNFIEDVKVINSYVEKHPQRFIQDDITHNNGSIECRSRLNRIKESRTGLMMYGYCIYNSVGLQIGYTLLDVYNP